MVGIFSRLSSRSFHRRSQSTLDGGGALPSPSEPPPPPPPVVIAAAAAPAVAPHGSEFSDFKRADRPSELLDNDQPVQCPLPEPSVLNDGRIWRERVSSIARRRRDMLDQTSEDVNNIPKTTSAPF